MRTWSSLRSSRPLSGRRAHSRPTHPRVSQATRRSRRRRQPPRVRNESRTDGVAAAVADGTVPGVSATTQAATDLSRQAHNEHTPLLLNAYDGIRASSSLAGNTTRTKLARFYLTTAIDYANGDPHLGHALEKIGADAIARYRRLAGDDVHFLMGMDEHGQKVKQAADACGVSPQRFVDQVASTFEEMWRRLAISNDQFIRTTDPAHKRGVKALIERIHEKNSDDFYEKTYEGWYCVGCELFKRENEIVDGRCVLHPTRELQWTEEPNWFFRLTRYQSFLERLFADRPDFLRPEARRNEILALLQ